MACCPNCTEALERSADGDYPPKCPKCGVKLKSKAKPSAAVVAAPPIPAVEERVVRSFSLRRNAPASIPVVEEIEDPLQAGENLNLVDESPFAEAFPADPVEAVDSVVESPLTSNGADNPFAPPSAPIQDKSSVPEAVNPFGETAFASPPSKRSNARIVGVAVAVVLGATVVGVGVWFGKDLFGPRESKERPRYFNPGRNYTFDKLPSPWKEDPGRAKRGGYELVLHRPDLGGWVTLRTELLKENAVDPKDLADEATMKWKERIDDFGPAPQLARMKLAKMDAYMVEGEGTSGGKTVRGRTLFLAVGGVKYFFGLEAPVDHWDQLERDFALARDSLEITGGTAAPAKALGENDVAVFASKKFPYRLSAPAGKWREIPELQTESRFDDLKLQDRSRHGEIVVQPRQTKDLPGMRVRFVESRQKLYENKVRELESSIEKLKINGRPAMRTILIISNAGGDFMLYAAFVQGDDMVFQIQCRAPVDKRDAFEPMFEKICDSFEVLDQAPAKPPEPETPTEVNKTEPTSAEMKSEPTKATNEVKAKVDAAIAKTEMNEKKTDQKTDAAKPPEKASAKKEPESPPKKTEATKKKKSLDDLD